MRHYCWIILFGVLAMLPQVEIVAQKTGKIENLLSYLVEGDTVKFQKNREKLDADVLKNFPDEMALVDALHGLWNGKKPEAAIQYFTSYTLAMQKAFPSICAKEKVDVEKLRARSQKAILNLLSTAPDKLVYSKQLIDAIIQPQYPLPKEELAQIYNTREEALLTDILKQPHPAQCELYLQEFPQGKFTHQVMSSYNDGLFHSFRTNPVEAHFKQYFDNATVNKFFEHPDNRRYMNEARSMYDNMLYAAILRSGDHVGIKNAIETYHTTPYLKATDRKHLSNIEYKSDSVDFHVLKEQVKSVEQLPLISKYLQTHSYKEFRDKADALRIPFEEQVIWTAPTFMRSYTKGLLMKANEVKGEKNISTTYVYSDTGALGNSTAITTEKGRETHFQTNYFFDVHGHCALEVQTDSQSKKELYRRTTQVSPDGVVLSDSLKHEDGRLILYSYDRNGLLIGEKVYAKDKLTLSVTYQYDEKGRKLKIQSSYTLPDTPQPTHVVSQTESYEYDTYGYLKCCLFEKVLANNDKTQGTRTFLYDMYGHSIDSNAYYEYDVAGRWIRKIDADNPSLVEYVQCIYKQP